VPVSALVSPMVCFMTTVPIRVLDASEHKSPSATSSSVFNGESATSFATKSSFSGCQFSFSDFKRAGVVRAR
jgi:hypothetical protein